MRFLRSEGARSYLSHSVIVFAVVQMLLLYISSSCPAHGQVEEEEGSAANASNTTHFPSPSPSPSSTTTLNFIFISSDNPTLRTSGSIPAVDIALEMVHQSGLLGDKYKLAYKPPLDSQVHISARMHKNSRYILILRAEDRAARYLVFVCIDKIIS